MSKREALAEKKARKREENEDNSSSGEEEDEGVPKMEVNEDGD